jgi:RNA polymerase sigma-70 factor (ECF subfamily)
MSTSLQTLTDNLRKGCKKSFEEIYFQYHKRVYGFCVKYGLDCSDAEEVTQEVFVRIWEVRSKVDPTSNFQSYLLTITRNTIVDRFKEKIREQAARAYQMSFLDAGFNDIEESLNYRELQSTIRGVMANIPEKRRKVFELSRLEGLSHKEISKELGISPKTVENQIALALQDFRVAINGK